jgi:hypothetical protein
MNIYHGQNLTKLFYLSIFAHLQLLLNSLTIFVRRKAICRNTLRRDNTKRLSRFKSGRGKLSSDIDVMKTKYYGLRPNCNVEDPPWADWNGGILEQWVLLTLRDSR